jgi:hypothetical protein
MTGRTGIAPGSPTAPPALPAGRWCAQRIHMRAVRAGRLKL